MYPRSILQLIHLWLNSKEILIIYGARQVGKTTLLKMLFENFKDSVILNCELPNVTEILESNDLSAIRALFSGKRIIAFDEAQTLSNIGKLLKLIYDEMPEFKIIATGSSSFELSNQLGEPLTGRNVKFRLFPLSLREIKDRNGWLWILNNINNLLVYGTYPGIIDLDFNKKQQKLLELSGDYLFKDLLVFEQVKSPVLLRKLLKALALQVGGQVSVNELANLTGTSRLNIEKYLDILEKSFIIFNLGSFSSNLRNEIKSSRKYYFYDNGILNALTGNFNFLQNRNDAGVLWENFCMCEIVKKNSNNNRFANIYFWRTYDGAEIDLVEEVNNEIRAFEFKWKQKRSIRLPQSFAEKYGVNNLKVITPQNLHDLDESLIEENKG